MKLFLPFILMFLSAVCSAQNKALGDAPLILEKFNFATPIAVLYPEKNKSPKYADYYEIRSKESILGANYTLREMIYENKFEQQSKEPIGIEYRQQSASSDDRLAVFGKQFFNRVNVATTPGGRITIIGTAVSDISQTASDDFIKYLTLRCGRPAVLKGKFIKVFEIYEWRAKDRMFRYAPILNDEKNVVKFKIDQTNKTIAPGEREPHLEGYFYIISNEYIKSIARIGAGDFAYLNAARD